ncbi:MAG: hypothetical protein U1E29_18275 [Coriobacteriia bacterium]|nr:hypothetical protein [Coriobacteriia bacterium]
MLFDRTVTVTENTGEDASGNMTARVTSLAGSWWSLTEEERRTSTGALSATKVMAVLTPAGFGDTWSVRPGDSLSIDGVSHSVLGATPAYNPRMGVNHHIEVSCG